MLIYLQMWFQTFFFFTEAEHKVETEIVQVDFKNENIYNKIASHLEKKNISVLINNVGVMLGSPMPFGQCSWDDIQVREG